MTLTPRTGLRQCRERAGLSIDDLARRIGTAPHRIPEHDRAAWLRLIESGEVPVGETELADLERLCGEPGEAALPDEGEVWIGYDPGESAERSGGPAA